MKKIINISKLNLIFFFLKILRINVLTSNSRIIIICFLMIFLFYWFKNLKFYQHIMQYSILINSLAFSIFYKWSEAQIIINLTIFFFTLILNHIFYIRLYIILALLIFVNSIQPILLFIVFIEMGGFIIDNLCK